MARTVHRWEAILLAAGASTRMGAPKALLSWGGRSLIAHQLRELLATRVRRVAVVLGAYPHLAADDPDVKALVDEGLVGAAVNRAWQRGKCGSIRLGWEGLSPSVTGVLLAAVDQPAAAEVLETLMGEHEARRAFCSVPLHEGRRGHPVLLSGPYVVELSRLKEEDQGMRGLLRRIEEAGHLQEVDVPAPSVRWDLNRPEDWQELQEPRAYLVRRSRGE